MEELNIGVRLDRVFGDYETQTPEGDFLCRTYFAEVVEGFPKIMEPETHRGYMWASYSDMVGLHSEGTLVPNLVSALVDLKDVVGQ